MHNAIIFAANSKHSGIQVRKEITGIKPNLRGSNAFERAKNWINSFLGDPVRSFVHKIE